MIARPAKLFANLGIILTLGIAFATTATAQGKKIPGDQKPDLQKDVALEQRLGEQIPLDTPFKDEDGKDVKLGDYFDKKPVILVLPFFKCRGSCALELDGMRTSFNKMTVAKPQTLINRDFNVLTVSIHPKETPDLGKAKKEAVLEMSKQPEAQQGWHFLSGSWDSIQALTGALGFRFVYNEEKDEISHDAGIIILTPKGKVSRIFYGVNYRPKDVRLALIEASENRIGSLVEKVTLFCSAFDRNSGKYTVSIMRITQIASILTMLILGVAIGVMSYQNRRTPMYATQTEVAPKPDAPDA